MYLILFIQLSINRHFIAIVNSAAVMFENLSTPCITASFPVLNILIKVIVFHFFLKERKPVFNCGIGLVVQVLGPVLIIFNCMRNH